MKRFFKSWSHSAISLYESCAFKYFKLKVEKSVKDEFSEAAMEGIRNHEALDRRMKTGAMLPDKLKHLEAICRSIEQRPGEMKSESQYCLDKNFQPCGFKDWTNGWLRGVIDVLKINGDKAWVGDWKSGKVKDDFDQLKLFAILVFHHYPEVNYVMGNYIWFNHNMITPEDPASAIFRRVDLPSLWQEQINRLRPVINSFTNDVWIGKTSGLCKNYCPVSKAGACPYYTK